MSNKRILTVQDISCVGQCSLTVALPIISACGIETCVLPSAVLSTHTGGFKGFTFRDLTDDIPLIVKHWQSEDIKFDAFYTGYLGSAEQIAHVINIFNSVAADGALRIVDPAMADNGVLYAGFPQDFPKEMLKLCVVADYIIPNITEACLMTDVEFKTEYDEAYIKNLIGALVDKGAKNIILTGVSYTPDTTGVVVFENGEYSYYSHKKLPTGSHGTGDVYASVFAGAMMRGKSAVDAARIAADFTFETIEFTQQSYPEHWYGVCFEPLLHKLEGLLR